MKDVKPVLYRYESTHYTYVSRMESATVELNEDGEPVCMHCLAFQMAENAALLAGIVPLGSVH